MVKMDFSGIFVKIAIAVIVFIVLGAGGLIFYFYLKGKKKFSFLLISTDGSNWKEIKATVRADVANKKKRVFVFENNDTELDIRKPQLHIGGKHYRVISYTPDGSYTYVEDFKISSDKYMELSLSPEEKQLSLFRMKENNTRFANPLGKNLMLMMGAMLILTLLLTIGIVFSVYQYAKISATHVDLARTNNEVTKSIEQSINSMGEITEQFSLIVSTLVDDYNLTRTVS